MSRSAAASATPRRPDTERPASSPSCSARKPRSSGSSAIGAPSTHSNARATTVSASPTSDTVSCAIPPPGIGTSCAGVETPAAASAPPTSAWNSRSASVVAALSNFSRIFRSPAPLIAKFRSCWLPTSTAVPLTPKHSFATFTASLSATTGRAKSQVRLILSVITTPFDVAWNTQCL